MGRSTSSCCSIIACGSVSVDHDDFERDESDGSTKKRGWSFRKRSARHRVLSDIVTSETPSTGNKEILESTTIDFHAQANPTVPEKISVPKWTDETPLLSTAINSKLSDTLIATENASKIDVNLEGSVAIVIQAAIRGCLAQRELLKFKNVIKLQAAIRGHLVRRQAVGTLRCVHAIVKIQALVRARHSHQLKGSVTEEKLDSKHEIKNHSRKPLGIEYSGTKASKTYSSTEKLLRNGFARQLFESTPKTRPIHIKCDPSKPSSAWKWLERWMSVLSLDLAQPQKPELSPELQEQGEKDQTAVSEVGTEIAADIISVSVDMKSDTREKAMTLEGEENFIAYNSDNFDFHASHPTFSPLRDDLEQSRLENAGLREVQETSLKIVLLPNQTEMQSNATSQAVLDLSNGPEMEDEQPKQTVKRVASEQLEIKDKKFVLGSSKACDPVFVAAQSKSEELGSTATSGGSINSICQDVGMESSLDTVSSPTESVTSAKELVPTENSVSHDPRVQVGGSECGTELSISSTLDSPDRSEVGGVECEHEATVTEKKTSYPNGTTDNASNHGNLNVEANVISSTSLPNFSYSLSIQPGKCEDVNRVSVDSVVAVDSPQVEQHPERCASDVLMQLETVAERQSYRSSPEGSPSSHITVPDTRGTPSSQVSVKPGRYKLDKSGSSQNRKSRSAVKRSPSNLNHDSGARSSIEKLPRDPKNGKRRISFGSARPDHVNQESRDSTSSSLPSYMQATESAKAKAHANNSPRLSPDVQDKDIYIKKRHSLPGSNGKQGSPRIQRLMPQAQQGSKGNGTHSPHGNLQILLCFLLT
ncbi:hypothetical protein HHK36_008615 [Tetracentron sinense]|uniref:DUF4005 domain-containing protein n=1 Tax=Tetracentron sinense TaxID=13715 RepID=A0A834ZH15_TETSI|nr:hypothetical protein HHK36_008615 [Tetracentron sinense]